MSNVHNPDDASSDSSLRDQLVAELDEARSEFDRAQAEYDFAVTDSGVIQEDRDSLRQLLEQSRAHLVHTEAAMERHDAGTYGTCEVCGKEIGAERLEALPSTTTCRDCST